MKILIVLTYFEPHKSGLTVYAVRQARALVERGHDVTVLTSRYDPDLPVEEVDHGVRIVRLPVAFRLSKGVIMPGMPFVAWGLLAEADIVNLHVPQVDAALVTLLARWRRTPVVLTYHCDIKMPSGFINRLAGWAANLANRLSARWADAIVHNTQDYAEHSPFLNRYLDKLAVIQPPIAVSDVTGADVADFKDRYGVTPDDKVIGMVARLATEKGVEYLVEAMPEILAAVPEARVLTVGDYENVFGEAAYARKLLPMIRSLGEHWRFLGKTPDKEKTILYHVSDVLVLPSINSTESFGMVQVEAMICGTPVVATDLPGVRQPVQSTGMGRVVPIRNAHALAEAVIAVLSDPQPADPLATTALANFYSAETVAGAYEGLYRKVLGSDD
ncbi:glycosyltransferase family 4 protein [bacterium]|nr:glycosyltransferase family 4 protein [bacterium]